MPEHAGENATELLKKRNQDLTHILYMCDALSSNIPKELEIIGSPGISVKEKVHKTHAF